MDNENLLMLRSKIKKRKPKFVRRNYIKLKLKETWRKPRGLHNKLRLKRKGHIKNPSTGYRSPKAVRNLDKNGLFPIVVSNVKNIESLDSKKNSLILRSTTGIRNRLKMLDKAESLKFTILNYKDIVASKERLQQIIDSRKKKKVEQEKIKKQEKTKSKKEKIEIKETKKEIDEEKKDLLLHTQEIKPKDIMDKPDKTPKMNITRTKITAGERQ